MAASEGASSQDERSLNEVSFFLIVLDYSYFSVMKQNQFMSNFRRYRMEFSNGFLSQVSTRTLDSQFSENGLRMKWFWKLEGDTQVK